MSQQRSYFIQPKSGSDWSASARLSDQEILNEFEKMSLPTYYKQTETQPQAEVPSTSDEYNMFQRPMEREYQFEEKQIPLSIIHEPQSESLEEPEYMRSTTTANLTSKILSAKEHPVEIRESETITVLGQTGIYANKADIINWTGPLPLEKYPINEDPSPQIVHKESTQQVSYTQEIDIRYLQPPPPQPPGEIVIREEAAVPTPPAPPIVVRQQPAPPQSKQAVIYREAPPKPMQQVKRVELTIPGKRLPPPPRRVVIERLPMLPQKPQQIVVERWLPYQEQKRKVVFVKAPEQEVRLESPRNLIIQWQPLKATVRREFKDLGVVQCNPEEYIQRYGDSLSDLSQMPSFVREIKPPSGVVLAVDKPTEVYYKLEGDVHALTLVDDQTLEREGLLEYKRSITRYTTTSSFETSRWPCSSKRESTLTGEYC